jgi:hypothetical protein
MANSAGHHAKVICLVTQSECFWPSPLPPNARKQIAHLQHGHELLLAKEHRLGQQPRGEAVSEDPLSEAAKEGGAGAQRRAAVEGKGSGRWGRVLPPAV